jgi:hypothetical protein
VPNIILTETRHNYRTNKICFTSIRVIFNFIWIFQDQTCLCIKTNRLTGLCKIYLWTGRTVRWQSSERVPEVLPLWVVVKSELRTVQYWPADDPPYKIETSYRNDPALCGVWETTADSPRVKGGQSAVQILDVVFCPEALCFGPRLADPPPGTSGRSGGRRGRRRWLRPRF